MEYFIDCADMLTRKNIVSESELADLTTGSTAEVRAQATEKLAYRFSVLPLDGDDIILAKKIIGVLANDKSELVRSSLTRNLHSSDLIPPELASKLIHDVPCVALPIIENYIALPDEEVLDLILNGTQIKKNAIAKRKILSADHIETLAEYGNIETVLIMASNAYLNMTDVSLDTVVKRFNLEPTIQKVLATREYLPPKTASVLAENTNPEILDILVSRHALPTGTAIDYALRSAGHRIDLCEQAALSTDPLRLAELCQVNGLLTNTFLMKVLCLGGLEFFIQSVSVLSELPNWKVRPILSHAGKNGLHKLLDYCGLSGKLSHTYSKLVLLNQQTYSEKPGALHRRILLIERILTENFTFDNNIRHYLLERHEFYYALPSPRLIPIQKAKPNSSKVQVANRHVLSVANGAGDITNTNFI